MSDPVKLTPLMEPDRTLLLEKIRDHITTFELTQLICERGYNVKITKPPSRKKRSQ